MAVNPCPRLHSTLLVAVDQLLLGHQHLFGLSFCRLGYSLGWQPQLLGALQENQHGLGRPKSHPPWMSNIQPGSTQGVLEKHIWVWVNTYRYHFYWDEHPFTSYFDVHQGYKVLTHCHMKACQGDFFTCFSHIFFVHRPFGQFEVLQNRWEFQNISMIFPGISWKFLFFCSSFFETRRGCGAGPISETRWEATAGPFGSCAEGQGSAERRESLPNHRHGWRSRGRGADRSLWNAEGFGERRNTTSGLGKCKNMVP